MSPHPQTTQQPSGQPQMCMSSLLSPHCINLNMVHQPWQITSGPSSWRALRKKAVKRLYNKSQIVSKGSNNWTTQKLRPRSVDALRDQLFSCRDFHPRVFGKNIVVVSHEFAERMSSPNCSMLPGERFVYIPIPGFKSSIFSPVTTRDCLDWR